MRATVEYPAKAARALGFLNSHNNDIEIYVEDTATPNVWVKFLRKYLPKSIRLNNVIVLGSRQNVLKACKYDQIRDGKKKLYIIDGDLDFLLGRPKPKLLHLYRLRGYCIENYLLDHDAWISAVTIVNPKIDEVRARRQLDLAGWISRNAKNLERLFIGYAIVFEMKPQIETVGYSAHRLLKSEKSTDFCGRKVSIRLIRLYKEVHSNYSNKEIRECYEIVRESAECINVVKYVSGKDYIFPMIYKLVKSKYGHNIREDSFKALIAQCLNVVEDPYLLRRLRNLCQ